MVSTVIEARQIEVAIPHNEASTHLGFRAKGLGIFRQYIYVYICVDIYVSIYAYISFLGVSQNWGTFLGVPKGIIVFWGLYWHLPPRP